jgi:hypothetical protein
MTSQPISFSWPEVAAHISNPISLAAYALAVVLYIVTRKTKGRVPQPAWILIGVLVIVPSLASIAVEIIHTQHSPIYRVRVTVLDPSKTPLDSAEVWSSFGGETKRVAGGWEIDIPEENKPKDGKLVVYARLKSAFWHGNSEILLGSDHNPSATVVLAGAQDARVRGIVVDQSGRAVKNARVYVIGYTGEIAITKEDGNFDLPAHAAEDQQVQLHAEGDGGVADLWHPAGPSANHCCVGDLRGNQRKS